MKRIIFTFLTAAVWSTNYALTVVANDSVTTGAGNTEMVYYQLSTGSKTTVSNTDWHLALSVQPSQFPSNTLQGASLRINEANGVQVYEIPGFTADSFAVVPDTSGYHAWLQVHDADTLLDYGALNTGTNISSFFYGWGNYAGPPTHNVVGTRIFLFELPGGAIKKFLVQQLDKDTAWDVQFADLDNSNLQTMHISKKDFPGKQYAYLNMLTNSVYDKEPLAADWDLQFLKYAANDVVPGAVYSVVGVWLNKGATAAKAEGVDLSSNSFNNYNFSPSLNAIGWNWKYYDMQNSVYVLQDSLAYFVTTKSGDTYKLIFTAYGGSANGNISFYKELVQGGTGIAENTATPPVVYPNPAQSIVYVTLPAHYTQGNLRLTTMSGQLICSTQLTGETMALDVSAVPRGVYVLHIGTSSSSSSSIVIIQ